MEADKKIPGRTIPMQPMEAKQPSKPTYEQVCDANTQLYQQMQRLHQENEELRNQNGIIRVNILLEVIKMEGVFSPVVRNAAISEIENSLYPPAEAQLEAPQQ